MYTPDPTYTPELFCMATHRDAVEFERGIKDIAWRPSVRGNVYLIEYMAVPPGEGHPELEKDWAAKHHGMSRVEHVKTGTTALVPNHTIVIVQDLPPVARSMYELTHATCRD